LGFIFSELKGPQMSSNRGSMASRFTNSPVITRLRNSPVLSAAKRWASGKASPKPQPRDPNPRRYVVQNSEPPVENNGQNRVVKFARNASPRLKKMGEGFMEAIRGGYQAMRNENVRKDYLEFLQAMGYVLITLYAFFAVLAAVYLPIILFVLTWAPGILGQILTSKILSFHRII
jgi:hypothetical protein